MRKSRVLREIRSGGIATSVKINCVDARIVEICGLSGASAVWLDAEHVSNDWLNLEHMIRAARLHDMDAIVRVAKGSYSDYLKPFESGAQAIMVPHVTTAAEAEAVVEITRFHPIGRRPLDGGNVDGNFCQMPLSDYVREANSEQFVILQIESPEAVAVVDEIAAVPGYECLLFGPGDFSHRMGQAGQTNSPEALLAREKVERSAKRNGKFCFAVGYLASEDEMRNRGYGIASIAVDIIALADGIRRGIDALSGSSRMNEKRSLYAIHG